MLRYLNLIRNISNWQLHFLVKFGIVKDDPLIFIAKNNIKFEVPKRLHHEFKEIFLENAYTVGLKKNTKKDGTIIDIGANVGFFTMFAASKYPDCTIYAYEPIKSNFQQLIKNRQLNDTKKIYCINKAVCGHTGKVNINFDITDSFTTSATIMGNAGNTLQTIEVPCLKLSDIFEEHKIDNCDLLKLDCEGAEYEILYSTSPEVLYKIDQIAIELHKDKNENENLKKFLGDVNFKTFQFADIPHMLWAYRT
jgi:FkbM family methyltransferase